MKRLLLMILTALLILSGCSNNTIREEGKLNIVTTLFPQYDLLRQITEDKATVTLLLPPGVEAHGYEPTPQDMVVLDDSDLFVYTSDHLESYAANMEKSLKDSDMMVINLQDELNIEVEEHEDDHDHEEHEDDHDHEEHEDDHDHEEHEDDHDHEEHDHDDPHFWLDPTVMIEAAYIMNDALKELDPDNAQFYDTNTKKVVADLSKLDDDFIKMFEEVPNDTIVFAGHFAFDYFSKRYQMNYITPFESYSANAEASTKKVAELIDFINNNGVKVVYFEELVDPKLANMLANETGAKTLMLHGAHNVSKDELKNNVTYIDIMYQNLENLREGLSNE